MRLTLCDRDIRVRTPEPELLYIDGQMASAATTQKCEKVRDGTRQPISIRFRGLLWRSPTRTCLSDAPTGIRHRERALLGRRQKHRKAHARHRNEAAELGGEGGGNSGSRSQRSRAPCRLLLFLTLKRPRWRCRAKTRYDTIFCGLTNHDYVIGRPAEPPDRAHRTSIIHIYLRSVRLCLPVTAAVVGAGAGAHDRALCGRGEKLCETGIDGDGGKSALIYAAPRT